ncbi:ubiquitin-conjugating enzyme, partial [Colletotrichum paranaense]
SLSVEPQVLPPPSVRPSVHPSRAQPGLQAGDRNPNLSKMSWRIQNLPDSQTNPSGAAPGGGGERDRGSKKSKSKSTSDGRGAIKRLIKELDVWRSEKKEERGIERLGPVDDEDLLTWEAVVNGRGIGNGYDEGRWLLHIQIPTDYPIRPPTIRFATPVVHANIALQTGEICLDLLKDAWTPAYSVLESVRAVRTLLAYPETDSPLNVDVAALLRGGDVLGTRALVEFWCRDDEGRWRAVRNWGGEGRLICGVKAVAVIVAWRRHSLTWENVTLPSWLVD